MQIQIGIKIINEIVISVRGSDCEKIPAKRNKSSETTEKIGLKINRNFRSPIRF